MDDIIEIIKNKNIGKMEENVSLKKYTTYRAGGTARCIIYPKNTDKLIDLGLKIHKYRLDYINEMNTLMKSTYKNITNIISSL